MLTIHRRPLHNRRPDSGFGLLEVLVATVIFMIGIVAMIRIFPGGMATVAASGRRQLATRLAHRTLAHYKSYPEELPLAVANPATGGEFVDPTSFPDDTSNPNSLDSLKRVIGEQHTVVAGGVVLLRFAPLGAISLSAPQSVDSDNPRVYQDVKLSEGNEFIVDPSSVKITFQGSQATLNNDHRHYRVTYTTYSPSSVNPTYAAQRYHYFHDYRITRPQTGFDPSYTLPSVSVSDQLVPGSVSIIWEKPISVNAGNINQAAGIITGLPSSQKVRVDYNVSDWRFITTEEVVPAPATGTVAELKLLHEGLDDETQYDENQNGTFATGEPVGPIYVTRLDTRVTDKITNNGTSSLTFIPTPSSATLAQWYQQGKIQLNTSAVSPGTRLRVTYATLQGWALTLQRAAWEYVPNRSATDPDRYRHFAWRNAFVGTANTIGDGADGDSVDDGTEYYLGFKASEAGKTVAVDYIYTSDTNYNPSGSMQNDMKPAGTIYGELHTIPEDAASPAQAVYKGGNDSNDTEAADFLYQIRLTNPIVTVLRVRGASAHARVSWRSDKGIYRYVSIASYLTPPS